MLVVVVAVQSVPVVIVHEVDVTVVLHGLVAAAVGVFVVGERMLGVGLVLGHGYPFVDTESTTHIKILQYVYLLRVVLACGFGRMRHGVFDDVLHVPIRY